MEKLEMEITTLGQIPPLGVVPKLMHALTIRQDRYGEPSKAFQLEVVPVPDIADDEVLIAVVSAGVNYNSLWACMGYPVNLIEYLKYNGDVTGFHITGSDAAGIVYKIGKNVSNVAVGDEVVIAPIYFDSNDEFIIGGGDPTIAPTAKAWGFETNWGGYAQFCKVKDHQCHIKPKHLTWDEAATYMLSGGTAYSMLYQYIPNNIKKGDVVLIWGGGGGLGVMAIQLALLNGAIPIAVVGNNERKEFCEKLGAKTILRTNYACWGQLQKEDTLPGTQDKWRNAVKGMRKEILLITGGKDPDIVVEHPGEDTLPVSVFLCKKGGMIVTCAGTTGYLGTFDLRYLWLHKKRLQGSHGAKPDEFAKLHQLINENKITPIISEVFDIQNAVEGIQKMYDNKHLPGSIAIRIVNNFQN